MMTRKLLKTILLVLFVSSVASTGFTNPGSPTIIQVSTSLDSFVAPTGSLEGGTTIYIKGTNFSPNAQENVVTIGNYPCLIAADGAKQDSLTCITTAATNPNQLYGLAVSVAVASVFTSCNSNNCAFSYTNGRTPFIDEVIPRSVVGGGSIYLFGAHRITNLGDGRSTSGTDIKNILIGDRECTTTDIIQKDQGFDANWRSPIECHADPTQVAGEYDIREIVLPGYARKSLRTLQTSYFTEQNYTQRVLAQITSVSSHQGGSKGQVLSVKGTGFSSDTSDYDCTIAGEICTVTEASLTGLTVEVPPTTVGNTLFDQLTQQVGDTSTQVNPFVGGHGARYLRYDREEMWKSTSAWLTYLRGTPSNNLVSEKVLTELSSPEMYGQNYVEYVKGYFYAPVDGVYRFSVAADDNFLMMFSSVKNNANPDNLVDLLTQQNYNANHYNSFVRANVTQNTANLTLTQGSYYYFEIVNVNYGGGGWFKVYVDMPSLRQYTINPTWQIDRVIIRPSAFDAEIISVKVFAASGSFDLFYYEGSIARIANIQVGASASDFKDAIWNLPNINNYSPTVTMTTLDAAGNPTNVAGSIQGYEYIITLNRYRPTTPLPFTRSTALVAGSVSASLTIARTSTHSAPLAGTFNLLINNVPLALDSGNTNIPFNVDLGKIEYYLNQLYQSREIKVNRVMNTQSENSIEFVIEYVGITGPASPVNVDLTLLTGGRAGTLPEKSIQILREYSNRQLYSPIPLDFIHLPSSTPALQISVKSLPAICSDCSYQFNAAATPVVSTATRSGQTFTFAITNPASLTFALTDIIVSYLGIPCSSLTGTITSFTCTLPINADSSVALPAGTGTPKVHIAQIGYADNSGLSATTVPITVATFSPAQTSPGGGVEATVTGTGFPISSSTGLSVSVCGNDVTKFTTVSNKQLKFIVPAEVTSCSGSNNVISYNGQQTTFTFAYNPAIAPQITSLSKTSSSPILKSTITITGSNFGAQASTNVYLVQNGENKYELGITSMTSTSISCVLGGGKSGIYDVVVRDATNGMSIPSVASKFSYKIVITSLSLSQGQIGGGYNLTVTGYNFATATGTNNVFIGEAKNSICSVLTSTATSIVCRMPRMMDEYTAGTALDVIVTGRILEESVCEGACTFTYVNTGASVINLPTTTTFRAGDLVTVTGTGLTGATVTINNVACVVVNVSDTSLNFTYPALVAGEYEVFINVANGWTYPQFLSTTVLSIDSAPYSDASLYGMQFKVTGNGIPAASGISAWFVCSSTFPLKVLSSTPTTIYIDIPKFAADASCRVNITVKQYYRLFSYNYKDTKTCSASISGSGTSYTLTYNNMTTSYTASKVDFVWLDSAGNPTSSKYAMTVSGTSVSTTYLPAGTYKVRVHSTTYGFAYLATDTVTVAFPSDPTASAITSSFVGGKQLSITGAGFVTNNPANNEITVCGLRANIVSATTSGVIIAVPPLVTTTTQSLYSLAQVGQVAGTPFGDSADANYVADNSFNTLYSSANAACYVGINFGAQTVADISEIRFVPNPNWAIAATKLEGGLFEGSNDGTSYTTIFTLDTSDVHSGWNGWKKTAGNTYQYQYVRFKHTSLSGCQLAELKVVGIKYSTLSVTAGTDKVCNVAVTVGNKNIANAVTYSHAATSVINAITPSFGPSVGGDVVRMTGTGFGTTVSVTIDGVDCPLVNKTSTDVYCTTGRRAQPPSAGNSFVVISDGNVVKVATTPYSYIDRWSDTETWGGQAVPREGDSVLVSKGMTLLVDQSTPILNTVIVDGGKIQFEDKDLTFDAHYFVLNGGEFEAGTETNRFQHKLTITLHGGYFDKQLPTLGNKVLGCRNCKFNMHGRERVTWTEVASTIAVGALSFTVINPVDWVAGEKIAVAATGFDHYETEEKEISSVSADGLTVTVTTPFKYRHFAATETFGSDSIVMRAEVGLLTRNIVVKGDDESVAEEYGSHLMLTGKQANGLVGKISYAEFTKCGQPKIVGRYCTHFHMAGEVPDSYIRGIAVHHSFARVLTIHGTHFLTVEKSVGFHVKGHNIFIEDGIETNNVIQDNLMMSSIMSNTMLQSDITVASYWITNPYNTVRRNHAAGGDFYGFWYEIKEHPDGPSATSDICPMGMRLGVSQDNVAHSNRRFGLRIFKLSARKYPCLTYQDESLQDPYVGNPPIESVFTNYTLWKNEECGFLGEELGYTTIQNFKTIDSRKGGMQFHKTNFTKELVVAQNCLVVGFSSGNAPVDIDTDYDKARGVIASRTDGLKFSGIKFYNFGPTMTPLQSCSECYHFKLWVTGGKTTLFENIQYTNIQGKYIFWEKWRREIFIDLDGTMSLPFKQAISPAIPAQSKAVISPYRPSLMVPNHCYTVVNDLWDNSVYCDQTITMRGILFTNPGPFIDFNAINIKVNLMASATENVTLETEDQFSSEYMIIIKKSLDIKNSWAMPFATGLYYNVHWKQGIDFTHMAIAPSRLWDANDGVVLRFNYSDHRELFQIGKWYQKQLQLPFIVPSNTLIDPATCQNADYFHDQDNKYLYVCVSGRNKKIREWIDLNGIRCLNFCPTTDPTVERQSFSRLWSNATQWPNQTLPVAGQNVTIPYEWNLVLDVDPPVLKYVEINGILIFDRTRDNKFEAHYIWVKQGIIRIGAADSPFTKNANIILHGGKNDSYLVIDPDASGNKMLAVTGGLQFYGIQPQTAWTKLTQTALIGATQIKVISAAGWKTGDKIVIAPSYSGRKQFEEVEITAISGNTITFTPALTFEHYGAATTTIENSYGVLDTRSAVGLLTRNIRVSPAPDPNNWGCRVLVYGYYEISDDITVPPTWKDGYAKLKGVQLDRCSQNDTSYGGIRIHNIGSNEGSVNQMTEIENSAIHGCIGFCAFIKNVYNLNINNNVFFYARKFIVYVEEVIGQYNFTNNLLIGARKRDQLTQILVLTMMADDVAAYEQYMAIDFTNANININVKNNLAQGSEGEGFVFPMFPCSYIDSYPFVDNTAGSCQVAFMYQKVDDQTCLAAKGCIGYASQIGLMANTPGIHQRVEYSNMFFADNERGVTLRYAHEIDDNTIIFKDSYVTGISRLTCTNCYGNSKISYCSGGYAIRMFTATITGETFPLKKKPTGHDVICTQQAFDFKAFLDGVTFENYLYDNPQLPYCSRMAVFKRHGGASDGTASHHLTNTKCINCETKSWAYFDKPNVAWRGWFGGCGEIDCTGPNNYLIHDQDGQFTGERSQILSNNSMVGDYEPTCQFVPEMNGHWCHTEELAVLQYESIAPDFNKRKMWPVYLKYDGGSWNSTTNGWKEWQWDGPEPMNLRLARFWSVIKLHQQYNLTYASQPPSDSRFQIQKRLLPTGNQNDWAIIRIYYPLPNSIEVLTKTTAGADILVKPFPIRQGVPVDLTTKTDICGANNFYYQNGTIEFVVNGKDNCQVRVRLSSYIQLSTRIDIPIADFYANNGLTSFITNICAFLGIDTGRLKIVGVREGSTVLDVLIQSDPTPLENSTITPHDAAAQQAELTDIASRLGAGLRNNHITLPGPVLQYSVSQHIFNTDGSIYNPEAEEQQMKQQSKTLVIVLAVVIPVVLVVAIVAGYCYWRRKRAQIHESDLVNNKSSANRENIKGSTEFEISAIDEFAATTKYHNKKWADNVHLADP